MKSKLTILAAFALFLLVVSGCYTQLGLTRDDDRRGEGYTSSQNDNDSGYTENSEYDNGNSGYYDDNGWNTNARVGFSYYYPSTYWPSYAFNAAYADPWCYDRYYAYDPWWCGTPIVGYGYGYYPSHFYYAPYYYYYPPAYYYGGHGYATNSAKRGTRDFGVTRGSAGRGVGETRIDVPAADRGGYNLPSGVRFEGNRSGAGGQVSTTPKDNSRQVGGQREAAPRTTNRASTQPRSDRGVRGWGSRSGNTRGESGRNTQTQSTPSNGSTQSAVPSGSSAAPSRGTSNAGQHQREPRHGSRDSGSSRGSAPSNTAPPRVQSAPPSSPPPSGGGNRGGGGSRGGRR